MKAARGECAPYTGLKLEDGSIDKVVKLLTDAVPTRRTPATFISLAA